MWEGSAEANATGGCWQPDGKQPIGAHPKGLLYPFTTPVVRLVASLEVPARTSSRAQDDHELVSVTRIHHETRCASRGCALRWLQQRIRDENHCASQDPVGLSGSRDTESSVTRGGLSSRSSR